MSDSTISTPVDAIGFFSPIPRHALTSREKGELQTRDVEVMALLLDYKNRDGSIVHPRQDTMATRLRCSLDTIQRSLKRLESAGLIVKTRLRDALGRLGQCLYDLAPLLARMPRHAARLRSGEWGMKNETPRPSQSGNAKNTMPHGCGVSIADSEDCIVKQTTAAQPEPVTSPVVVDLVKEGVGEPVAKTLAREHSPQRVREVIGAANKAKNRPAWIVAALKGGWSVGEKSTIVEMPRCQRAYRVPNPLDTPKTGPDGGSLAIVESRPVNAAKRILAEANSPFARARRMQKAGTP